MNSSSRLLLFDIDGTLLACGDQTRGMVSDALRETYGVEPPLDGYSFAGRTDRGIVFDLMGAAGVPVDEIERQLPRVRQYYLELLDERLQVEQMRLLPGASELLETLSREGEHAVGLLTGNWSNGARIKLERFGLGRYFGFGSFGEVSVHRKDLLPAALDAAHAATGRRFMYGECVLIGDSVRDVECALHHGAEVIAVSTGGTSAEVLVAAGATHVVSSLDEVYARL